MAKAGKILMNGQTIVGDCRVATDAFSRFLGLMGKKNVAKGSGVLFPKCNSIHTFFMRIPIDVVFIDGEGEVKEVIQALGAWRMLLPRFKAKHILELGAGHARDFGIRAGTRLKCEGVF